MSNMIRQIMALFDEYQSKQNAKHTLRAMKENARQGFWNGALPPIGYRIVEAAEQRGHRTKKTLEIDPIQAETVRLIYRLAREGNGSSGSMGVKSIAKQLNESGIRTRDGGRWGVRSKPSSPRPVNACGPNRAATGATTSVHWPSASRWTRKKFASWGQKACSCARWLLRPAQKRQVLEYPVLYRSGAPGTIRTSDPQIRSLMLYPAELRARFSLTARARPAGSLRTAPKGCERAL